MPDSREHAPEEIPDGQKNRAPDDNEVSAARTTAPDDVPLGENMEIGDTDKLAGLFLALAEPSAVPLLEFIAVKGRTIPECAAQTHVAIGLIEPQLATLERLGWIRRCRERYVLADQRVTELVRLTQSLVANKADALMQCQHIDQTAPHY